jgi:pimeloyl-ACP methyl ester carboxylesterase
VNDATVRVSGRAVGFAEFGAPTGTPVVWCHGGPGSRLEPGLVANAAEAANLRLIGIDRPGYGNSTPRPGRTIADCVPDAIAVLDHLAIDRAVAVGVSTGGAYALACATIAAARVRGVVACCAMTDMRNAACRAMMSPPHTHALWDAPDRATAMAAAVEAHGEHGERLAETGAVLPPADRAMFADREYLDAFMAEGSTMFTFGQEGYTDDRLADGGGWTTFDVASITCPVIVIQGDHDVMVAVEHARYTASIVPGAELRVFEGLGHFSIIREIVPAVADVLAR